MSRQASYGSWKSPITSDVIVAGTIRLGDVCVDGEDVYWTESRPAEGGRNVLVRLSPGHEPADVTPPPFNVRTRVHEYGGGAFTVHAGIAYFSNFTDQRLYRKESGREAMPLTPAGDRRYADARVDPVRKRLICICEDHTGEAREPVNQIISVSLEDGSSEVLTSGCDFYAGARLSPDGSLLAWFSWNHPDMPWDATGLWVADYTEKGLSNLRQIAGGPQESAIQPEWGSEGTLYFVSDRSGWWNLYRWKDGETTPLHPMQAEFGEPHWVFGHPSYAVIDERYLACIYNDRGTNYLAILDTESGKLRPIEVKLPPVQPGGAHEVLPCTRMGPIAAAGRGLVLGAASPASPEVLARLDLDSARVEVLRRSSSLVVDPAYISAPETLEFPTAGGRTAYGFYYPPKNPDYDAPAGEKPPLLVLSHGGPTSAAAAVLSYQVQFWTSRGIGVLDINYGGSTGYGREYRERLKGSWGIVDVEDCVNGALYLVDRGEADPDRLAIRGGSAGGYTTLCALTFRNVFRAGASHFGVSDLVTLAQDTHKFESRYLDGLIGPYPEREDLYRARSPIHFTEQLSCPLIVFQGLDDRVVPPAQAELMVESVRQRGLPVAYVPFEGEQHGFRKAENIKRALDAELYFYSRIFGFVAADPIDPVEIENLGMAETIVRM